MAKETFWEAVERLAKMAKRIDPERRAVAEAEYREIQEGQRRRREIARHEGRFRQ